MEQIVLEFNEKQSLIININLFKSLKNKQDQKICITNVANTLFNLIQNNHQLFIGSFFEQFIDKEKQFNVSMKIAKDFFCWIKNQNIQPKIAVKTLQQNLIELIESYSMFQN